MPPLVDSAAGEGQLPRLEAFGLTPSGDAIVVGQAGLTNAFGDVFVASFDAEGRLGWERTFSSNDHVDSGSAAVGADGATLFAGYVREGYPMLIGDASIERTFVARLDPAGQIAFARSIEGGTVTTVALDSEGNGWALGFVTDAGGIRLGAEPLPAEPSDRFLVKYDPAGQPLLDRLLPPSARGATPLHAAAAGDGGIVVVGTYEAGTDLGGGALPAYGHSDIFVARFGSDGELRWSRGAGGAERDAHPRVAVTAEGEVVVAGHYRGEVHHGDAVVAIDDPNLADAGYVVSRYDDSGTLLSTYLVPPIWNNDGDQFYNDPDTTWVALGIGPAGEALLAARTIYDRTDFGGGPLWSSGSERLVVAAISPLGEHLASALVCDETTAPFPRGVAADAEGRLVVVGGLRDGHSGAFVKKVDLFGR